VIVPHVPVKVNHIISDRAETGEKTHDRARDAEIAILQDSKSQ